MTEVMEYSGFIRNWKALCSELEIDFSLDRNERENQILIKAYRKYGIDMAEHLYGSFAFAIWIEEENTLLCMRDQFGAVPFYYYTADNGDFFYSSSIRDIMSRRGFKKELNQKLLQIYLSLTYVPGEETFFKGLKKLLPGHYLLRKNGLTEIHRYWKPEFIPDNNKTLEDWAEEINTAADMIFNEDCEPAETFLSSGVDSSYILAKSRVSVSNSCGYEDKRLDESALAAQTAAVLGKKNRRFCISPNDFFSAVPYVMYNMEQPLGDASAVVFALGCRAAAESTDICYSGEGADEFFCGYNIYRNAQKYSDNLKNFYVGNTNIMKEDEKKNILKNYDDSILPINLAKNIYEENSGLDPLAMMSCIDIQLWLEADILLNVSKMSRAAGLDVRMPLLDRRMFSIASRIPAKYKLDEEQNKIAFRTAAAKVLPEEIAFRKKLGFVVPIRLWLADERYNGDVKRLINSPYAEQFFNISQLKTMFDEYIAGNSDLWRKIWTIYAFLVWYEEYFIKR